ncbi:EAL domain-containing response regulator [Actimicrobium sp. CCC2.4]|uniref:EAL domain-containing response regulator n=1 Tax=Actimicrobium sp. CCC2.4 TaxID=3048606 RepID=UPI002AC898E6|nr:EAL domain-containing response regulator [Actimicrobium sp. CCC2.4]MEB0136906.1 EAL domain-containing response regulator [Actimicrobium sp. CCC2.4]WPX33456.1 EAL domain-containing response regulator [Actimicrobium sp. CCC2.4]
MVNLLTRNRILQRLNLRSPKLLIINKKACTIGTRTTPNEKLRPRFPDRRAMNIADMNFLVVQEDALQRQKLNVLLGNLGARNVIDLPDGTAALALLQDQSQSIDIGFIDLQMDGMDGIELIRHMGKFDSTTAIIISGVVDPALIFSVETMSRAYGINLLGFVQGPATNETLASLISSYTARCKEDADCATVISPIFNIDDILHALDNSQIKPWFQPKVELASGQVRGVEAFARWHHPRFGIVLPDRFIPVLEQHQQLDRLTSTMIDQSAAACRRWHDAGFLISVSINLGSALLLDPRIADQIAEQVAAHRLATPFVIFEITESALRSETPACLENMLRLRMKGFELSVDDYGTGNASMQQLLRIPFSELKIDRSFVAGAAENNALALVLSSSLALASKLDRLSVAVGIETRDEWNLLKKMGCTYGQGYYIAKPMEATALPGWMTEWSHFF